MKNFFKLFGITVLVVVIGMTVVGCDFENYSNFFNENEESWRMDAGGTLTFSSSSWSWSLTDTPLRFNDNLRRDFEGTYVYNGIIPGTHTHTATLNVTRVRLVHGSWEPLNETWTVTGTGTGTWNRRLTLNFNPVRESKLPLSRVERGFASIKQ